ncbi:polymorphic toxin-type HINT domain-containing protein, partial [Leeia sp.]|uniref:polymorphic toxin-type HINT domain-containing protein n=1 Tax=Leeia sp. TaxID=2884678 RepID=UPI0035AE17B2
QNPERIAQLQQTLDNNAKWQPGGNGQLLLTAVSGAFSSNVTGSGGDLLRGATINYLQGLGAREVKQIADQLDSEVARTALHGLLACAGAAAQNQSCGSAALGASSSVVINNLLDSLSGKDSSTLTAEQKKAREDVVSNLIGGITQAAGGDAAIATLASRLEMENNYLSPSQQEKFAEEVKRNCRPASNPNCAPVLQKWKALSYKQGGLETKESQELWEQYVLGMYEKELVPACHNDAACLKYLDGRRIFDTLAYANDAEGFGASIKSGKIAINYAKATWSIKNPSTRSLAMEAFSDVMTLADVGALVKLPKLTRSTEAAGHANPGGKVENPAPEHMPEVSFCTGGACFVAGTVIHTDQGPKAVETFQTGEMVWSRSEVTAEYGWRPVINTKATPDQPIYEVVVRHIDTDQHETLHTTSEHPFWVLGTGWRKAALLEAGMPLINHAGEVMEVVSQHLTDRVEMVYNIEVEDFHTYHVGELGVWVHNADCCVVDIISTVKNDPMLLKVARNLSAQESRGINFLMEAIRKGNFNPGAGTKQFGKLLEFRHPDGGRIYAFRNEIGQLEIVGYSGKNKAEQQKVIDRVQEIIRKRFE